MARRRSGPCRRGGRRSSRGGTASGGWRGAWRLAEHGGGTGSFARRRRQDVARGCAREATGPGSRSGQERVVGGLVWKRKRGRGFFTKIWRRGGGLQNDQGNWWGARVFGQGGIGPPVGPTWASQASPVGWGFLPRFFLFYNCFLFICFLFIFKPF
jgi:hypothetical protein